MMENKVEFTEEKAKGLLEGFINGALSGWRKYFNLHFENINEYEDGISFLVTITNTTNDNREAYEFLVMEDGIISVVYSDGYEQEITETDFLRNLFAWSFLTLPEA